MRISEVQILPFSILNLGQFLENGCNTARANCTHSRDDINTRLISNMLVFWGTCKISLDIIVFP